MVISEFISLNRVNRFVALSLSRTPPTQIFVDGCCARKKPVKEREYI